jgi:hypothetical protein
MKKFFTISALAGTLLTAGACKKVGGDEYGEIIGGQPARVVRYELYTRENFSGNQETIHFGLYMRTNVREVFDSALAVMKIEDIPDSLHRIIIERQVPEGVTDTLAVGFSYAIDGVGVSWYQDLLPAGDTLKVVRFSFD